MTSIMTLLTLGMTSSMKIMNSKYHTIYIYMAVSRWLKKFMKQRWNLRTWRKFDMNI